MYCRSWQPSTWSKSHNHPDYLKHVLVTHQDKYARTEVLHALRPLLGDGLFTSDPETWKAQRRLLQPAFHPRHLVSTVSVVHEEVRALLARSFRLKRTTTEPVNVVPGIIIRAKETIWMTPERRSFFVRSDKKKKGKRPVSHRYDLLPLLPSGPDGFQRELTVQDSPFSGSQRKPRSEGPPGDVEKNVEPPSGLRIRRRHGLFYLFLVLPVLNRPPLYLPLFYFISRCARVRGRVRVEAKQATPLPTRAKRLMERSGIKRAGLLSSPRKCLKSAPQTHPAPAHWCQGNRSNSLVEALCL